MKTIKIKLVLTVEFDPHGEDVVYLKHNMNQVVRNAVNNGVLTGDSPSTVEHYNYEVTEVKNLHRQINKNKSIRSRRRCSCCGSDSRDATGTCKKCGAVPGHFFDEIDNKKCSFCGSGLFDAKGNCQQCGLYTL
jgi:hypothetical protein